MARYTGPKFRLDRRVGTNLMLKGKRSINKHPFDKKGVVKPGVHGPKGGPRKLSDFGLQLAEKQKLRYLYGLMEKQFHRYFEKASKMKGETGQVLMQLLEARLDNVIYRLGFAASRSQARQLVGHGHVTVNGTKVNIPSFEVKIGDKVSLKDKAKSFVVVVEALEERKAEKPDWLKKDDKKIEGELLRLPDREEINANINEQLIIEFYSR